MEAPLNIAKIVNTRIDFNQLLQQVSSDSAGAISTFSGTTRNHFQGKKVLRLEYEAYEPMAEKKMQEICSAIRQKWKVMHIAIVHRVGVVPVGEASVVIAISSVHRADSLLSVQYAIDEVKALVPVWKKEFYETSEGVEVGVWKENSECCFSSHKTLDESLRTNSDNHTHQSHQRSSHQTS